MSDEDVAYIIARLPWLIEQGKKFTYHNFSSMNPRGYPNAYSEDWLVWAHRINEILPKVGQSPSANSIARGLGVELLGNDSDSFDAAHASIVNGLQALKKILEADQIPASDRIVTLGHNSPEQTNALEKIDSLVEAVRETNDFPGSDDDKEQAIAELSAGRKLLEAAKVRVLALKVILEPRLRWLVEKGATAVVGKLAGDLLEYLINLHLF